MKNLNHIEFEVKARVAVISLNRPDAANGINLDLSTELAAIAKECDENTNIKCVVLTGNGRFFSAGGDIKEMASHGAKIGPAIKTIADNLHMAISTFSRMRAPLIVAVNGVAAGGGFSLAITGDIVLASDKAAFIMAYTKAGLSPDGSSSYYLPRLIGLRRAQELAFLNRQLTAQEAVEWGLAHEVVKADQLQARAITIAETFANGSAGANAAIKKLFLCSFDNSIETQMELEGRAISEQAGSPNGQEGIKAFLEKRKPRFS